MEEAVIPEVIVDEHPKVTSPFELFCHYHMDRVAEWMKHHKPHEKLPIIETPEGYRWLNRTERRRLR